MKRMSLIPFVSALIGGALVAIVIAVAGGLGSSKSVTTVQAAATPLAPSNASAESKALTPHDIYVRDAPGVVLVTSTIVKQTESPFGLFGGGSESQQQQGTATGSGIVIGENGTILTNWHVVENAVKVTVSLEQGKTVNAQVVGKDPSNDLAVLRIPTDGLTLHPLTLGDSSKVQVGDPALAIGNPFGQDRTLTTGVISALQRHITAPNGFTIYERPADRRADQPRQLGRSAAQRARTGDRHQLSDRDRRQRWWQRGHRLRRPDQHRQDRAASAREGRHGARRLPRSHVPHGR